MKTTPKRNRTTIAKALPTQGAPIAEASNVAQLHTGLKPADEVLREAAMTIINRGAQRDSNNGTTDAPQERSMVATVAAFNAIEGTSLTPRQGWAFMQTLKMVRAATSDRNGVFNADDFVDGAAYAALGHEAAEAAASSR